MCLQHISDRRLQRRSPLCCPASDWQAAAGCLSAAPSTWSPPAATEGNTPGRRSSPPHRTPPSPPPSPNLTERQRRRKNRNIFRSLSSVQKCSVSFWWSVWTTSINTQTQHINYHFFHCNNQYCHKCVWEAEKAAVTPTTCRVRRAPACSTEQSDWRTKCFITYLYSQFIFVLQTFRDVQEYKKKSIYN